MKLTYKKGREEAFSEKIEKRRLNKKTTVITLLAVGLLVLLMMSPLFNVRNIRVTGISQLTNEAVQRESGISEGINIFKISTEKAEKQLSTMAYVDSVKVVRKLPATVEIRIVESTETAYVYFIGNYVGIDINGKILEIKPKDAPIQKPVILGTNVAEFGIGNNIKINDAKKQEAIFEILKQIEANKMQELIKTIDVADLDDIKFFATAECTINMGGLDDIIYKMSFLKKILEEPGDKRGAVIDMTNPQKVTYRGS